MVVSRTRSAGITPPSSLLRAHAPVLPPPRASVAYPQHQVCAGCCQPLLGEGPSRRCLCASVPACLDPYPGGSCGARTRFFPHDSGLPPVRTGSALHNVRTATSVRRPFRGCSHSLMFRPAGVLATQIAPTDTAYAVWQPWFFRPSLSRFVTSPCPGYAYRPHRAIDGRGLAPHQMRSLVGCSPNAGPQAPPMAAARHERSNCLGCQGGLVYFFSSAPPGVARASDA